MDSCGCITVNLAQCLEFRIEHWPSLDSHAFSKHGISMKGDIIEVCLAALRGNELFEDQLQVQLQADGLTYPIVFLYMCELCRLEQYMDACLHTGFFKMTDDPVAKLVEHPLCMAHPLCRADPFVQLWKDPNCKYFCLAALFVN